MKDALEQLIRELATAAEGGKLQAVAVIVIDEHGYPDKAHWSEPHQEERLLGAMFEAAVEYATYRNTVIGMARMPQVVAAGLSTRDGSVQRGGPR